MNNPREETIKQDKSDNLNSTPKNSEVLPDTKVHESLSMHDGVPVWYDCCSCEAEPYWAELAGEAESPEAS